jgi:hypothetical protein
VVGVLPTPGDDNVMYVLLQITKWKGEGKQKCASEVEPIGSAVTMSCVKTVNRWKR